MGHSERVESGLCLHSGPYSGVHRVKETSLVRNEVVSLDFAKNVPRTTFFVPVS